jgi:hypothetical protein
MSDEPLPEDLPYGDLYDERSEYLDGWHAIQVHETDPEVLGTLFVVEGGSESQWTLLDRPQVPFGFCRPG